MSARPAPDVDDLAAVPAPVPAPEMRPARTSRQADLFDALLGIFLAEGFAQFTLADLAARLRCSKSTLYALAHSKEQLAVAVARHFFRVAAERIERDVAAVAAASPAETVGAYLGGVARELRPASPAFRRDLAANPATRAEYERNTRIAARRIRELVAAGVDAGVFRGVDAAFVGQAATAVMSAIQRGDITAATGLSDADAYAELASLLRHGLAGPAPNVPGASGSAGTKVVGS
ncbi:MULTISPECIES: TetR/AcrR family transcriptional regulator [unclassified Pseudofrankia]|uniref:TetR/AcrR family transcriptional regulator n=1 Tax=unclassified Pseudofrankia TaxID=2994372 RepID=UPI000A652FB6|nr:MULTISPECIES: TetR/AcrR family transcriptional regulator [unclassified Pseudofrankia]MDT3445185.1 TetR/AcrR family transcriptional regulator [Pseudofrankia sp. BMG5.37]